MNAIVLKDLHIGQEVYQLSGWSVTPLYISEIKKNEPCSCRVEDCAKKSYKLTFRDAPLEKVYRDCYLNAFASIEDTVAITEYQDKVYFNLNEVQEAQKAHRQHMYDLGLKALQAKAKELAAYQEELDKPLFGEGEDFDSDEIPESIQREFAEKDK